MAMSDKEKKQLIGLIAFLGLAAAGLYWYFIHQPATVRFAEMQVRIDSLNTLVDAARKDLARGSVESLRQKVEEYEGAVRIMRRLVPEAAEVANLIDDVTLRAKARGVNVVAFTPLGTEPGTPFHTVRYKWSVAGHFDQVGEFLADVGGLPRIMVPYDVTVGLATGVAGKLYGDSTASLLEVGFQIRTFVKPPATSSPAASETSDP